MLIKEKIGNINSFAINNRIIDYLLLEWHESNKRILHKKTQSGKEVIMKFLKENQNLTQGDIVYEDESSIIAIDIIDCDVIIIRPKTMLEMASVCYEIGNKHLPLFFCRDEVLVAYEAPLFRLLVRAGYDVAQGKGKLINPLKTTVETHVHTSEALFSRMMKRTTTPE